MADAVNLSGYISVKKEKKTVEDVEVEIVTYQGEPCDEYLVRDVESGRCSLFYKGILQLSWKVVEGKIVGGFTLYEKGKALRSQDWNGLAGKEHRCIENCKDGLELVIEGDGVVYRGGFDDVESMKREGRGMEFDEKSGKVLRCGVWKNDELFHINQECEDEEVMIEYEMEEEKENVSVLNRHPVYEGGYVFDEEKREVLRNGYGCEIDVNTGIAVREGTWERGELKESVGLFEGWYVKLEDHDPFDWGLKVEDLKVESHNWNEWKNVNERVTELVIPSNCCNEADFSLFDVSELKWLKSISIANYSCQSVNEVKLMGMKRLEKVTIGENCFKKGAFYLKNCPVMKELRIGVGSFVQYTICEFEDLPSLERIEMGDLQPQHGCSCFQHASLELKSIGRERVIGRFAPTQVGCIWLWLVLLLQSACP